MYRSFLFLNIAGIKRFFHWMNRLWLGAATVTYPPNGSAEVGLELWCGAGAVICRGTSLCEETFCMIQSLYLKTERCVILKSKREDAVLRLCSSP